MMGELYTYVQQRIREERAAKAAAAAEVPAGRLPDIPAWQETDYRTWFGDKFSEGAKKNAAVLQCLAKLVLAYSEAPIRILMDADDTIADNPVATALLDRLKQPNPFMGWEELQQYTAFYMGVGGNAYWYFVRSGVTDEVLEIWPKSSAVMWPRKSRMQYIDAYMYDIGDGKPQLIDVRNVAHFRWPLVDPADTRLGLSPIVQCGQEAGMDSAARKYALKLLDNDAMVRGVIVDSKGKVATKEQKELLEKKFQHGHSGENVGKTAVLTGGLQYQRLGLDMDELAFDALHRVPEARISGAFLMDVLFSGLTAGMEASTYDNRQGARQFFYEDTIVKLWRLQGGTMTRALLPQDSGMYFWHYTKDVIALRADQNGLVTRVDTLWKDGVITLNQALSMLDLQTIGSEGDMRINQQTTPAPAPIP